MYVFFFICILGAIAVVPIHFLSVEHLNLQRKYGKERGIKIGKVYGLISGWGFFLFWAGIWFSPQAKFFVPIFQNLKIQVPIIGLSIPIIHIIVFAPFFVLGAWLGIAGVRKTTLKVAETHKPEKIVTKGVYAIVRHPQYLGGLLAHVGISFLFSGWCSLLSTPLMIVLIFFLSKKEEKELAREFGKEYADYQKKVPMLIPKFQ